MYRFWAGVSAVIATYFTIESVGSIALILWIKKLMGRDLSTDNTNIAIKLILAIFFIALTVWLYT